MSISDSVRSQYHAALAMMDGVVAACPAAVWDDASDQNRTWLVVYHALLYTDLYLHPTHDSYEPWEHARVELRGMGEPEAGTAPYSRAEMQAYVNLIHSRVDQIVPELDWTAESGFDWIPLDKLELQFYSIRHLQQHIGELAERLWVRAGIEVDWIGRV